jgi:hypothetical protein
MIYPVYYREWSSCSNRASKNANTLTNLETSAFYVTRRGINKFTRTHQIIHVTLFCCFYGMKWNNVLYCWGHYLVWCTSPEWWMMMSVEQSVKCLTGETEALGGNLPQCRFVQHKSLITWPDPGSNPGCRGSKPATNLLSYGTASVWC